MSIRNIVTLAAVALPAPLLLAQEELPQKASPELWYADFDKAQAAARESGKDLLVDFTGSDWCGWCHRLDREVFAHDEFVEGVKDDFVLVALDFPRGEEAKAAVPDPERNAELQQKYEVRGFPTVLAMTADGVVYGRTGYAEGGPVEYVASLTEMREVDKAQVKIALQMREDFSDLEGEKRTAMIEKAIGKLADIEPDDAAAPILAEIVGAAYQTENEKLRMDATGALLKSRQADANVLAMVDELDPENEHGFQEMALHVQMRKVQDEAGARAFVAEVERVIENGIHSDEQIVVPLAQATNWALGPLGEPDKALKLARQLEPRLEHAEEKMRPALKQLVDKALEHDKKGAN